MSWKAEAGSTLMLRSGVLYKEHLHFLLSDPMDFAGCPTQSCLLVCVCTIDDGQKYDDTCILEKGHPFIKVPSYVPFNFAEVKRASELEQAVADGTFRQHEPVDLTLVRHLLSCLILSPRASRLHKSFAKQIEETLAGR